MSCLGVLLTAEAIIYTAVTFGAGAQDNTNTIGNAGNTWCDDLHYTEALVEAIKDEIDERAKVPEQDHDMLQAWTISFYNAQAEAEKRRFAFLLSYGTAVAEDNKRNFDSFKTQALKAVQQLASKAHYLRQAEALATHGKPTFGTTKQTSGSSNGNPCKLQATINPAATRLCQNKPNTMMQRHELKAVLEKLTHIKATPDISLDKLVQPMHMTIQPTQSITWGAPGGAAKCSASAANIQHVTLAHEAHSFQATTNNNPAVTSADDSAQQEPQLDNGIYKPSELTHVKLAASLKALSAVMRQKQKPLQQLKAGALASNPSAPEISRDTLDTHKQFQQLSDGSNTAKLTKLITDNFKDDDNHFTANYGSGLLNKQITVMIGDDSKPIDIKDLIKPDKVAKATGYLLGQVMRSQIQKTKNDIKKASASKCDDKDQSECATIEGCEWKDKTCKLTEDAPKEAEKRRNKRKR
uniref:Variant surface glycoprotein 1125.1167 n=1 Tax=Trypanosoma brucei TaxID=5691 RepID=A0A1J0R6G0_9TRYP|nr:variant surface glycoprotein 1125.1167 [Trypanosoma brucei]